MKDKMKEREEYGRKFLKEDIIDIDVVVSNKGMWSIGLSIGDEYYETDPYTRKEYALSEAKGYLEGVKAQLEDALKFIENEMELEVDNETANTKKTEESIQENDG